MTPVLYGKKFRLCHGDSGKYLASVHAFYSHALGSWQQIVGGNATRDESTVWLVKGPDGTKSDYKVGEPVSHGDFVRLEHVATQKNLHSHSAKSPITGQQEVSAFQELSKGLGEGDGNDNWRVDLGSPGQWTFGAVVKFEYRERNVFLHSNSGHAHPVLTAGLQEVTAHPANTNSIWRAEPMTTNAPSIAAASWPVEIFISHSFKDRNLAGALVKLIQSAFNLSTKQIRCSSVTGYKFPLGSDINDRIKAEVEQSKVFIALVTPSSLVSPYVLFEMGARWGRNLFFASLIANGAQKNFMKTPVSGLLALSATDDGDLHTFLAELADKLGRPLSATPEHLADLKIVHRLAQKRKRPSS